MLLSEKFDKLVSFELDIPHEISFNFHHRGTFRQETPKSLPKLSMQANNSFKSGLLAKTNWKYLLTAHNFWIVLQI